MLEVEVRFLGNASKLRSFAFFRVEGAVLCVWIAVID